METWKCWASLAESASTKSLLVGHPVVASACWYLDYSSDVDEYLRENPVASAISSALRKIGTTHFPLAYPTPIPVSMPSRRLQIVKPQPRLISGILGGEAAMWTERVDYTNFECRVWPRAILMASNLWGHVNVFSPPFPVTLSNISTQARTQLENSYRGRSLIFSYITVRSYLVKHLRISAAAITLHRKEKGKQSSAAKVYSTTEYTPLPAHTDQELFSALRSTPVTLGVDGRNFQSKEITLRSQCPMIPQSIQRPVMMKERRVVQINLENGAPPPRETLLQQWLEKKSNEGVLFIGLCELNGWHHLESTTDVTKNFPLIRSKAAKAGFVYSHLFHAAQHPFNLGIISALPFTVQTQIGPPIFQRGMLHVYFSTLALHVFVCHLHAHNSTARELETKYLMNTYVLPLLQRREKVLVMGDLNSLYEGDRQIHEEERLADLFKRKDHPVFQRLQQKFMTPTGDKIDYRPLHALIAGGLVETCIEHCRLHTPETTSFLDSIITFLSSQWLLWMQKENSTSYEECVSKYCSATEPTHHNPEVFPSSSLSSPVIVAVEYQRLLCYAENETRFYLCFASASSL